MHQFFAAVVYATRVVKSRGGSVGWAENCSVRTQVVKLKAMEVTEARDETAIRERGFA